MPRRCIRRSRCSRWWVVLGGAARDKLGPRSLNALRGVYRESIDENARWTSKGKAKVFCRTYAFLSSVIPYATRSGRNSRSCQFVDAKVAAPRSKTLQGHPRSHRHGQLPRREEAVMKIALADTERRRSSRYQRMLMVHKPEPELDRLSNILKAFNDQFAHFSPTAIGC